VGPLLALLMIVIASVVAWWAPLIAWAIVALFGLFLAFQWVSLRSANVPLVSQQWSAAASTMALLGALVALVGLVHGFWLGLALAVANYLAMSAAARGLDPHRQLGPSP
jgi:hypothetical protein